MPAPKSEPSPNDSELTMRTADEDGEALHSNTPPASHINSLKRQTYHETTTPPRTKMKLCSSVERGDHNAAKSSTLTSSPNDSSSSISDPPVKKAKLLKATSASCGETPSPNAYSKAPLKRAASTDSEDELSSDDSKTDLFRDKSDGDKARSIRKYANRVKGKRRAEESLAVPQEKSQGSSSAPSGMIKMDHNYGRFSHLLGFGDTNLDVKKENITSVTKGERQELLVPSAQFEPGKMLSSFTLSAQTCIELKKCETSKTKPEVLKDVENPKPTDKASVALCRQGFDSAAALRVDHFTSEEGNIEKTDNAESVEMEYAPIESQVSITETLDSTTREEIEVGNSHTNDITELACARQTEVIRDTERKETTVTLLKEIKSDENCSNTEAECEGLEETAVPAIHIDIGIDDNAFSNDTHSEPEKIQVESKQLSQTEVNLTSVSNADTHMDTREESLFVIEEESKSEPVPAGFAHEPVCVNSNLSHQIVSQQEGNVEESERNGSVTVVPPVSSAEVQLNLVVVDKTNEGYPEITTEVCTAGQEQNQKVLPCCDTNLEHQTDTCGNTEVTLQQTSYFMKSQHEQNHKIGGGASEAAVEVTTNFELMTGPSVQIEMVEEPSEILEQEFSNQPALVEVPGTTSIFDEDQGSKSGTVESQNEASLEHTTVHESETLLTGIPSPTPTVEVQTQREPTVSQLVSDTSPEEHHDVTSKNSKIEQNEGTSVFKCTDGLGGGCTTMPDDLDMPSTVQIQQSPEASEGITSASEEKNSPVTVGLSSNNVESIAAHLLERMTSNDFSSTTAAVEMENQQNHNSADKDRECPVLAAKSNENESASLAEGDIPAENNTDLETTAAAASAEVPDVTDEVMVKVQMNHEVSEVHLNDREPNNFSIASGKNSKDNDAVECMDTTDTDSQMVEDIKATQEDTHHLTPAIEVQDIHEMCDVNIKTQREDRTEDCKRNEEGCGFDGKSVDSPAGQVNMETPSTPSTLETFNGQPVAEVQNQGTTEVSGFEADVTNQTSGNDPEENKLSAEVVPNTSVCLEPTETIETCNVSTTDETEKKRNIHEHFGTQPESESGNSTPKEDKPTTEHAHIPMDTTASSEKFLEASPAAVFDVGSSLESSKLNAEAKDNFPTASFGSTVDQNRSIPECFSLSEAPTSLGSPVTQEIISDPPPALGEKIHESLEVSVPNTGAQSGNAESESEKDKMTGEYVDASETQANVECTAAAETVGEAAIAEQPQMMEEVREDQVALFDEVHTFIPVVAAQNKSDETMEQCSSAQPFQMDAQPISRTIEGKSSGYEEETMIDEGVAVSAHELDAQATSYPDRSVENEEFVFACHQTEKGNSVVLASAEQKNTVGLLEGQMGENQVVYEPISSPESNGDTENPVLSENHEAESALEIQNTMMQKTEEDPPVFKESQDVCAHIVNKESMEQQTQVPASCDLETKVPTEVLPETCFTVNVEQNDTVMDMKQVAPIGSGPDSSTSIEVGNIESNGYPNFVKAAESPEREIARLQEVTRGAVVTAASEVLVMEDTDTEFVTLVPVPQSDIDFDIVTQAAAESGLSVSYTEEVFHGGALAVTVENKELLNRSQLEEQVQECQAVDKVQKEETQAPDHHDTLAVEVAGQKFENEEEPREAPIDMDVAESNSITNWPAGQVATSDLAASTNNEADGPVQEVQVLQDMELGHEIVVGIAEDEGDNDVCVVEKPRKASDAEAEKKSAAAGAEKDNSGEGAKQEKKPKKQEMNTQARTKARLAALAEQKAAASKRSANKQQLNLLALCQEIADDIATDSTLLQRIEEEKQAAAATAAAAAASEAEASKEEPLAPATQDPDTADAPAVPTEVSTLPSPAVEVPAPQPSPAEPSEANKSATAGAEDLPKRRFFVSQVSVPLKAHEKKKLTRYQRLRQVELQREKMSWARVKKMKSEQASQALSDMDWQAPLHTFSQFSMGPAAAEAPPSAPPPPAPKTPPPAKASMEAPEVDGSGAEKTETPQVEAAGSEPAKAAAAAAVEGESPAAETRKSPRQSRTQAAKETPPPAAKVTRSATKRALPAVPPPMPNGVGTRKQKPVEYTPYKPRPKYTFDDFELDDDPVPPPARPPQQAIRPNTQGNLTGRPRPAAISPQLPRQMPPPAGQVAAQSKPTAASAASPQSKPSAFQVPQSKAVLAQPGAAQLKQATPTAPRLPTASAPAASSSTNNCKESTNPGLSTSGSSVRPKEDPQQSKMPQLSDSKSRDTDVPLKTEAVTVSTAEKKEKPPQDRAAKQQDIRTPLSEAGLQKGVRKLKEADKDGTQTIIDAGQKHFGAVACSACGMLYSAANPEDESQHLLFHNKFISAVKYVGWKKERILSEYPDGKIILVLPDDPKYALRKVEEIREVVDSDLGFQQVETKCPSKTKTFLFISNDKKVSGCLIAEHIQEGYRVIEEPAPEGSEGEKVMFERQRAWCCSTTPEPAICGISRIWVVSMMRRQGIASRMLECLRNNFAYGSYLSKDEIAFSDPTPDGKLFATHYFGTSQFLVYNFVSGTHPGQPKTDAV